MRPQWITNVKLGGAAGMVRAGCAKTIDLALRAAAAVGADFAGVDLIRGAAAAFTFSKSTACRAGAVCRTSRRLPSPTALAADLLTRIGSPHGAARGSARPNEIAEAFIAACRDEIEAPKPGNVHVFADGHGMTAVDFLRSAEAAAPALRDSALPVGARILGAVEATFAAVRNEHQSRHRSPVRAARRRGRGRRPDLRDGSAMCRQIDPRGRRGVYAASLRAAPGGLGTASATMSMARRRLRFWRRCARRQDRDRVAFQYASDFTDIFEPGLARDCAGHGWPAPWPVALAVYLAFLSGFPDSHIARKLARKPQSQ